MALLCFVVLLLSASILTTGQSKAYENCTTKRSVLVNALFETGNNLHELDKAFYPQEGRSSYLEVNYKFQNSDGSVDDDCKVTYIWAVGGFLFLQPPEIFMLTSLFFSLPANDVSEVNLVLPYECRDLVETNSSCQCNSSSSSQLEMLTHQVGMYTR